MAITSDGQVLITGGSEGTRLWSARTFREIQRPTEITARGDTTALLCVRRVDEPVDVIYSGTSEGYFFCWRQRDNRWEEIVFRHISNTKEKGDITAFAWDDSSNRLALCTTTGKVQVWGAVRHDSGQVYLNKVFSRRVSNLDASGVLFDMGSHLRDKDVFVFGFNHTGPIGGIQADAKKGLVLLDNSLAGPSFWRFHDQAVIKTYSIARTRNHYRPKNVRLADAGTTVVAGGDHGDLYVFDTHSGNRLEKLSIGTEEFVQVVITAEVEDVPTIFASPSREGDRFEVMVWKRLAPKPMAAPSRLWERIWSNLLRVLILCCCVGFLVQNLQQVMGIVKAKRGGGGAAL
ncbi:hypothetical protein B0H15DRAFT_801451 [Mycena belliarum]|uniref:WD40 repeat-like protein n=1 Tax=Mycena belliarum TaxID=1033014 RepID=A0AAD6U6Q9_9AGAR|nr:hypothetical protein B0H15DRAFT_801451 [Mycena belliae]